MASQTCSSTRMKFEEFSLKFPYSSIFPSIFLAKKHSENVEKIAPKIPETFLGLKILDSAAKRLETFVLFLGSSKSFRFSNDFGTWRLAPPWLGGHHDAAFRIPNFREPNASCPSVQISDVLFDSSAFHYQKTQRDTSHYNLLNEKCQQNERWRSTTYRSARWRHRYVRESAQRIFSRQKWQIFRD